MPEDQIKEAAKEVRELLGELHATDPGQTFDSQRCINVVAKLENMALNWLTTARLHAENEQFYHDIVIRVGKMFGDAAKTADDGTVMKNVLALRVEGLVADALKKE